MFDLQKTPLKIDKPIRLIELFAGIGSQAKALERLGANFEHYRVCEFDKYAIKSYNAIHGTNFVTSDITEITAADLGIVDTDKFCYMMTYSFPCQDLSVAGKGNGMAKGSGTRSGLLWEVERLLNECCEPPQILLMENVTQVHGKKNKEHFEEWIAFLESKGYSNYWTDLNSKNFGIPQNRNRTFMVSVLGDYTYEFPQEFSLELKLKDMLENYVDEKFYIKNFESITAVNKEYSMINGGSIGKMHDVSRRVYSENGISPTIHTCGGGNTEPKVIAGIGEKKSNGGTQWYQQDRIYDGNLAISVTTAFNPYYAVAMRGRYNEQGKIKQKIETSDREIYNAITTVQKDSLVSSNLCIRKLTPKECWRLMGFDDEDFEKAAAENSNTQLYKQAGNSIVVDVLYYIFKNML
jgi:DNA (cytosine-5)-methyltransferase 1